MRPRSFRLWLALALCAGLGSCDLNPQPIMPGSNDGQGPSLETGGAAATPGPQAGSSSGGSLNIGPSGGSASGGSANGGSDPTIGLGGANDSASGGGSAELPNEGGAGGTPEPGDAGGVGNDVPPK